MALQDFSRTVGIPNTIKTDNAKTETGERWTNWCRKYCVNTKYTEPHYPWQNISEHGIGDLGRMVKQCMRAFNVPLSRHQWYQRWCCDVRNTLALRKLAYMTLSEKVTGKTPELGIFRLQIW